MGIITNKQKHRIMKTPLEQYEQTFARDHETKRIETTNGITLEIRWSENGIEKCDKLYFDKNGFETKNYSKPYAVDNGII